MLWVCTTKAFLLVWKAQVLATRELLRKSEVGKTVKLGRGFLPFFSLPQTPPPSVLMDGLLEKLRTSTQREDNVLPKASTRD